MPNRRIVAKELAGLLKVLAHPDRILIVQLLASRGEHSVNSIAEQLHLPQTRVSQHLGVLRGKRIVEEKRDGRLRLYNLPSTHMAWWLVEGVDFVAGNIGEVTDEQIEDARKLWVGSFSTTRH
jgi:DNA-binding transcriptional ArsR family regulator